MDNNKFIRIGNDRLRLSCIESYGIKPCVRYFVHNEAHSEVEHSVYDTAFTLYNEDEDMYNDSAPVVDVNGYPVYMDKGVVQEGKIPPNAFDVEAGRVLYVNIIGNSHGTLLYVEGRVDFNIDDKIDELDRLLIES